jgi:hypothetical protein
MKTTNIARLRAKALSIGGLVLGLLVAPVLLHAQQSAPLPTILSFAISPTTVENFGGQWIEFSWRTRNTDRVRLYRDGREIKGRSQLRNGEFGFPTTLTGGFKMQHSESATYELVAENEQGKAARTIVVPAGQARPASPAVRPQIVSFRASPTVVEAGRYVRFFWKVRNAETIRLYEGRRELRSRTRLSDGTYGWSPTMPGTFSTTQRETTTYRLVARSREGKISTRTVTVRVRTPQLRGTYTIQQKSNGRYLDAHQGTRDNSVVTRNRQRNNTQSWILTPVGKHAYRIQQKSNGRYLDAHEGSHDNSVVTRDRQGNTTQVWIVRPLGSSTYTIQQKSNGRYLDAHEGSRDNSVVTRDRQNNDTQRWIVRRL